MIIHQIKKLGKSLKNDTQDSNDIINGYNNKVNKAWDHIRWFIALHFKFNQQVDSEFWKHCNSSLNIDGVEEYLAFYMEHGPIDINLSHPLYQKMNKDSVFGAYSFDIHMLGCGVNEEKLKKEYKRDVSKK